MTEELKTKLNLIRDQESAIRVWELLRDYAQRVVDQSKASSEKHEDSIESVLTVAQARASIDKWNASILASRAIIDELERVD
jgi:hypothetical protein